MQYSSFIATIVVLNPVDELHAKFNSGALLLNDTVHLMYRWAEIKEVTGGFGPAYVQNFVAYARMTPEGKLLYDADKPTFKKTHSFSPKE